jgi:2',3'-cyclic-nucleotide 2'-phosphodiesterase (5'-nucleotidase family)
MKNTFLFFLFLIFLSCQTTQHIARVSEYSYQIDGDRLESQDSSVIRMIQPYKGKLDKQMNEVIASAAITLTKAKPQSTLGNWMADAIKTKAEEYSGRPVDFAAQNYGGIRISELRKGPVTRGKMYELMPFENRMVILELDGATVQSFLDHTAAGGGWPLSKEVRMVIDGGRATEVMISEQALQANKNYLVVLPDYIANGGDSADFLVGKTRTELPNLIREALIEYAEELQQQGRKIDAEIDFRVKIKEGR